MLVSAPTALSRVNGAAVLGDSPLGSDCDRPAQFEETVIGENVITLCPRTENSGSAILPVGIIGLRVQI